MDRRSALQAAVLKAASKPTRPFILGGKDGSVPLVLIPESDGTAEVLEVSRKDNKVIDIPASEIDYLNDPNIVLTPCPDKTVECAGKKLKVVDGKTMLPDDLDLYGMGGGWKETSFYEVKT